MESEARNTFEGFNHNDCMKTCRFRPYKSGPCFTLKLYYLIGTEKIGYKFSVKGAPCDKPVTIFEGNDFRPSPLHSIDGDETVKALMGFLCLRKGDTDAECFEAYDSIQRDFSESHAESVQMEVYNRFGYDD